LLTDTREVPRRLADPTVGFCDYYTIIFTDVHKKQKNIVKNSTTLGYLIAKGRASSGKNIIVSPFF
jgi:hypothetical protein